MLTIEKSEAAYAPPRPPGPAITAGADAPRTRRLRALGRPRCDPYWLAALFFAAYTTLSIARFQRLANISWDLGIFEQAVRAYAHLQAPVADLKGPGANILGDHFSPIVAVLAPVYRLFPGPLTLLTAQAALFAVAVIPVTRVAARLLGRRRGLAIGVAYGLSWGVQRAVDFDFHEIAFAVPLIAFSLEAVLRRRPLAALCWALPLVLVKEDLGVTAAAIGLVVLLRFRREDGGGRGEKGRGEGMAGADHRVIPFAIALIGLGIAASGFALGVVIPGFNTGGSYAYWEKLNGSGPAPVIAPGTALRTLLWVLLPTSGLLALRSPLLIVALPTLGWRFLSHDDHYWGTDWHYSAVLMPVVMLALVDALDRSRAGERPWLRSYARQLPLALAAVSLALTTSLPLAGLTETATYRPEPRVAAVEGLLDRIPDGASVEANIGPISRLTSRCRVFWIGDTRGIAPEYIALNESTQRKPADLLNDARHRHPKATYAHVASAGGTVLLRRTSIG
ncbi:DUF2079 domain-containing protein [Streptomyces sp. H27-D2]|uniref:DUF2079 domain-containing protein n=1 Tax=Streptomyces sp. H27-D2 TaxID=3046304 RepID=UPI002DBC8DD0|nr:DUF2079 domain-containing protein [Streptomyces sp. H27-D2]MEC4017308.1 DUF2079 domain-containing protein [Streptomyces sp. H27-D2]